MLNGRETVVINDKEMDVKALGGRIVNGKAVFELGAGRYVMQ